MNSIYSAYAKPSFYNLIYSNWSGRDYIDHGNSPGTAAKRSARKKTKAARKQNRRK